jgi:hypothetical protein
MIGELRSPVVRSILAGAMSFDQYASARTMPAAQAMAGATHAVQSQATPLDPLSFGR